VAVSGTPCHCGRGPVVVVTWYNHAFGGHCLDEMCESCVREATSAEFSKYIRSMAFDPVAAEAPWVPDGLTAAELYGVLLPHGPYCGLVETVKKANASVNQPSSAIAPRPSTRRRWPPGDGSR
jgi:hypothetical protein